MTSVQNITLVELDFFDNQGPLLGQIVDSTVYGDQLQFYRNVLTDGFVVTSSHVIMNQLELTENSVSSLLQLSDCTFVMNGTYAAHNDQGTDGGVYRLMNSRGSLSHGWLTSNYADRGTIYSNTGEIYMSHYEVRTTLNDLS